MLRALLPLILALLLVAGGVPTGAQDVGDSAAHAAHAGHGCCPHGADQPDEGGDRCDLACDQLCCAAGVVVSPPAVASLLYVQTESREYQVSLRAALLISFDRGPPPTPPPIG